jgi:general secretion pathway protein K
MRPAERGFALLIVLWTLVLVTLLVSQLASAGRMQARLATNQRDEAVLDAAADGAIDATVFHLLDQSGAHWPANGTAHQLQIGGIQFTVRVTSEADRIDPNTAPAELLAALLRQVGVDANDAKPISEAMVAWRTQAGAANDQAASYRAAGYLPPGTQFQSLDEIGLVHGVTPDLLAKLTPHLQLFRPLPPSTSTADPVVLAALADWSGLPPGTSGSPPDDSFVAISIASAGPDDASLSRQAVVHINPGAPGAPFQVLASQSAYGLQIIPAAAVSPACAFGPREHKSYSWPLRLEGLR